MSEPDAEISVRVNNIDYVVASAGPMDDPGELERVPVLRIYGTSSTGAKACVHVHQVYPYFYIEYAGLLDPDSVNSYIANLQTSLNHALALSLNRNKYKPSSRFIRAITLVKGIHFYGFHYGYSPFLKILINDPALISRAVVILQAGRVMGVKLNVFESHLSYPLQFMCDFGLYGCGPMDLASVSWRAGGGESLSQPTYFPVTRLPIEIDVISYHILNRHRITPRNVHDKLRIPAPSPSSEPLVLSVRELWEDERRRRIAKGLDPTPDVPKVASASTRGKGEGWVSEARNWEALEERIRKEQGKTQSAKSTTWESWVMTTFESVQALWPESFKTWRPSGRDPSAKSATSSGSEANPFNNPSSGVQVKSEEMVQIDEEWFKGVSQNLNLDENGMFRDDDDDWERWHHENQGTNFAEEDLAAVGPPPELQWQNQPLQSASVKQGEELQPKSEPDTVLPEPPQVKRNDNEPPHNANNFSKAGTPLQPTVDLGNSPPDPLPPRPSSTSGKLLQMATLDFGDPATRYVEPVRVSPPEMQPHVEPVVGASHAQAKADVFAEHTGSQGTLFSPVHVENERKRKSPHTPNTVDGEGPPKKKPKLVRGGSFTASFLSQHSLSQSEARYGKGKRLGFDSSPASEGGASLPPKLSFKGSTIPGKKVFAYALKPPSASELLSSMFDLGLETRVRSDPYYSKADDAPERAREYGGLKFRLRGGIGVGSLEEWANAPHGASKDTSPSRGMLPTRRAKLEGSGILGWEYSSVPPSRRQAEEWLRERSEENDVQMRRERQIKMQSQIEGPTPANTFGFKITQAKPDSLSARERQAMSVLAVEVFVPTDNNAPDPEKDMIAAVSWCFQDEDGPPPEGDRRAAFRSGILVVKNPQFDPQRLGDIHVDEYDDELELIHSLVDLVHELDPDILAGWEVQRSSWGYIATRGREYALGIAQLLSRAPDGSGHAGSDNWSTRHTSNFKVTGRHVLNVWRVMRAEQTLGMYSFENFAFHILHQRVPKYTIGTLTKWFRAGTPSQSSRVLTYHADRTSMVLEMLDEAEVITKTAEFARVFGIEFFSVIFRGSQFKVESFMFRIGKPESLVFISPSKSQVGRQNAAECMPLVMEPMSAFYKSPLVVLDFQSLYPSTMIAYNYCYSTCLGRVDPYMGKNKLGVIEDLELPAGLLETVRDQVHISANGMVFVKPTVRQSLLAKMLSELLDTRVMVKNAMKLAKGDKALLRLLDARQLSLKFIANVTYGYTSASFSGRMPAVEIADAIVQSGRETLEKAIAFIESHNRWGARVVYGDTDSLFIYLPGKTKEEAFRIGNDIADQVTARNPPPIKLKFEKVYLPCVLQAKKRYVGFKYEHPDEVEPKFDAKGIETVRRDGVPAQQKMLESALKLLFRSQDLSKVKEYCWRSWTKILEGRVSIQDFTFAKEVRMGTYSDKGPPPPGVTVAAVRMIKDPNDEPQYGDRIPYVIIRGELNGRLVDRAVAPEELFHDRHKRLDAVYYITRVLIPPLARVFNLVGADVQAWYDEMPKTHKVDKGDTTLSLERNTPARKKGGSALKFKIDDHFQSSLCVVCGKVTSGLICPECLSNPEPTLHLLYSRMHLAQNRLADCQRICASCSNTHPMEEIACESLDCPWLYERKAAGAEVQIWKDVPSVVSELDLGV